MGSLALGDKIFQKGIGKMANSHDLVVFIISTVISTSVAIFDHWLASNPAKAANSTWQFLDRLLHGLSQKADVHPEGIKEHIIADLIHVAEHTAEQSLDAAGKATAQSAGESRKESAPDKSETPSNPGTPNFGAGGI